MNPLKITILCQVIFLWEARIGLELNSNYCTTATKTYLQTNNYLKTENFHEIFSIIFFFCRLHYLVKVLASNLARFFEICHDEWKQNLWCPQKPRTQFPYLSDLIFAILQFDNLMNWIFFPSLNWIYCLCSLQQSSSSNSKVQTGKCQKSSGDR